MSRRAADNTTEATGWRKYHKTMFAVGTSFALILGIAVSWNQLGLPTVAMSYDIAEVHMKLSQFRQMNVDTRVLILQVQLKDARSEKGAIDMRLQNGQPLPNDIERRAELEGTIDHLKRQIGQLTNEQ